MVLEHQGLLNMSHSQTALQLYAAAAAQLAPRNRVPNWAPFLQFGMHGVFGNPFLNRNRFGSPSSGPENFVQFNSSNTGSSQSSISPQQTIPGPPSEDSNDEKGEFLKTSCSYFLKILRLGEFGDF